MNRDHHQQKAQAMFPEAATAVTADFTVSGMTCEHCVRSVTEEVQEIDAVTSVEVDLASGALRVTSSRPIGVTDVAAAVEEAGYQLR